MRRKIQAVALLALIATVLTATIAFADNVKTDVVVNGNDSITTSTSTTIHYYIQATGSEGAGGGATCDASDGSAVTITIVKPAAVTASPGSLIFTSCGVAAQQAVAFSSSTAGNYSITVTTSDSSGTYNDNSAAWTLKVTAAPPANTAPT